MTDLHDTWISLRHGGNLLSPTALGNLPEPKPPRAGLADRLRGALVALGPDQPESAAMGALLDAVLEGLCDLHVGWTKGAGLGPETAQKLLDGTRLKPRRLWNGPQGGSLAVFSTDMARLGVGKGRRPVAHVTEYLRRRGLPLGLLTNGRQWRLIWADTDSLAWVEWDADRWLEADQLSATALLLRRVLSFATLTPKAELSPLLAAIRDTRRGQAKLSSELGERVRQAVEILLRARTPVLDPVWDDHRATDLYVAACHLVMRLVVVLFAEARELLPVDSPVYHQAYGLKGLIEQLDRQTAERRRSRQAAWPRLLALFRLLHGGSPHPAMVVPRYGGDLFEAGNAEGDAVQRALAVLESVAHAPDDDTVYRILVRLTRTEARVRDGSGWRRVPAPVDFTELTSEYIGILYEGLLDYELHRAGAEPVVFLNLGDQPALPLDRLEGMDEKALAALVEKAKVKKKAATEESEDEDSEDEDGDEDSAEEVEDDSDADETTLSLPREPGSEDESASDDARAAARARATDWARLAVRVGKLVKAPRRKKGASDPAYLKQLDSAADQLVAALKLPGELYLVRWGGTRKGAGTFYTKPQLTLPTVRRTLEPLLYEDGKVRPPEALLALKVGDPAMGSGSFLVAALRVLTKAVIEALHVHGRITTVNGRTTVDCEVLPEADRAFATDGFEDRLEALVRRAVVEHCLYGVDLDPLAVELARVALWVETLDRRLPFTFLDHKLRCGDSLIGTWLDRFRFYPLLAFARQSPDQKRTGVHFPADVWHKALMERKKQVIAEQAELVRGQERLLGGTSDEELRQAVERVRRLYRDLRAVPAGRPDERARIWRDRILGDAALQKVRAAFDTWCALWFWPLDRIGEAPGPGELHAPPDAAAEVVRQVRDRMRFFHWELEFPDVFTEEGAGFDAIVGNPPWEIQKPSSKEFFSNHDPLYRAYGKQEALNVQGALFEQHRQIEEDWLRYNGAFKDKGNFVKHAAEPFGDGKVADHDGGDVSLVRGKGGEELHRTWRTRRARFTGTSDPAHPFRHQGSADLNTYKMFVEAGHALLRAGGQLGMVVPSGLYTDKGSGGLRKLLLQGCAWRWLYGFENRNKVFDIHRSFKFCVCIAAKGGRTSAIRAAFMRHDLEDWAEACGVLDYPAERVRAFSPKSLSVLEIRSERDLEVLTKMYANGVLLGDAGPDGWSIKYAREFDMTNDSKLFIQRDKAEAEGFQPDAYGRWVKDGEVLLPLYEGRMIGQFDFSEKGWVSGKGRSAEWREIPWDKKRVEPQFLVAPIEVERRWAVRYQVLFEGASRKEAERLATSKLADPTFRSGMNAAMEHRLAFMDVTASTNSRTMIAVPLLNVPCGNSAPVLLGPRLVPTMELAALFNSFAYDFAVRARCGGLHLNWFVIEESAVVPSSGLPSVVRHLTWRLLGLGYPLLSDHASAKLAITQHERLRIRCALDAVVAALFGLDRSEFAWILRDTDHPLERASDREFCHGLDPKGFWRIDSDLHPELRHTVLSLAAFDDLQSHIDAAGGDRDTGIEAFCNQNDGEGWMLPETVCIADLSMTRTVDVDAYDDRARTPQPVRSRLGERFLPWQLEQTPEESWAECERHARAILGDEAFAELMKEIGRTPAAASTTAAPAASPAGPNRPDLGPLFASAPDRDGAK